ncbi:MAG: NUDIX domain-containing protein [Methanobrevibacter sp.]|nr:NUDIX domain-containing protein [Methanobrevibacter sp.]
MIYFYGGSFDPVTNAHIDILKAISKKLRPNDMLMVGVANNDEKNYKTAINYRFTMVQDMVNEKLQKYNIRVVKQENRTYKFLQDYIAQTGVTINDFTICIGEDEWKSLCAGKWVNYELLLKHFKFLVVNRDSTNEIKAPKGFNTNVTVIKANIGEGISASKVREILSKNPDSHYEDVKELITHHTFRYIKENEMYWQNGPDYDKKEKKFLADYAIKKKENNWGEPSVTTDTIAYNGNQILLIRRGNYPYKNYWCFPGGFFEKSDEDLNYGAARELREETTLDLDPTKFEQIRTYGHNFDPRMKIVDTAFAVRVPKNMMKKALGSDDAADARWFDLDDLPNLGFHHAQIIEDWLKTRND